MRKLASNPALTTLSEPSSSRETPNSSSTTNTSRKIFNEDLQKFDAMFTKTLDAKKFWTLSTGTVVELKMEELAMKCTHEQ